MRYKKTNEPTRLPNSTPHPPPPPPSRRPPTPPSAATARTSFARRASGARSARRAPTKTWDTRSTRARAPSRLS
eukprot:31143-Pelagococcus_subviridis.AAC.7